MSYNHRGNRKLTQLIDTLWHDEDDLPRELLDDGQPLYIPSSPDVEIVESPILHRHYRVYTYRWTLLASFSFGLAASGFCMVGFSAVSQIIAEVYDTTEFMLSLCVLVFLIMYVPSNFVVLWVLNKYGLRITLMTGAVLSIIGVWSRFLIIIFPKFGVILISTSLIAFAQPFWSNTTSKLATVWFADNERAMATALGSLALPIGCIMGFAFPPFFIFQEDISQPFIGKQHFIQYLLFQSIFCTALFASTLLIARNKPKSPPSASASAIEAPFNIKQGVTDLIQNKSYVLVVISFNFLYGIYTSIGAVVAELTSPYGYKPSDNSIFAATFVISGVIGSFIISIIMDKTGKYKLTLIITCLCSLFSISLAFYTLPSRNVALFTVNLILLGLSVLPIIPIGYSFSVEVTFPVPEALSNGMMVLVSQLFGTVLGIVASIVAKINPLYCIGLYLGSCIIATIASFFVTEDLRRIKMNKLEQAGLQDGSFSSFKRNSVVGKINHSTIRSTRRLSTLSHDTHETLDK